MICRYIDFICELIVIYGLILIEERRVLWSELFDISFCIREVWCVVGDFNIVFYVEDRINGLYIIESELSVL